MLFIDENNTDPCFNHALEEHFLTGAREDCFIVWRNAPCVLLGRHQNTAGEIDADYARRHGIIAVRRMSGGGAVFNDLGNINFCFIAGAGGAAFADFGRFAAPVIEQLRQMGVPALLSGRNDITVEGRKISGNAQARHKDRMLHHGTLMYSVDRQALCSVLKVNRLKYADRAVQSVEARTANIADYVGAPMTAAEFKDRIFTAIMQSMGGRRHTLTDDESAAVVRLRDEKYATWEWNYGVSPEYNYFNCVRLPQVGLVEVRLNVSGGRIAEASISGDFFGSRELMELERLLAGLPHEGQAIGRALGGVDVGAYIAGMSAQQLLGLLV